MIEEKAELTDISLTGQVWLNEVVKNEITLPNIAHVTQISIKVKIGVAN
jgi:hypothetical protein